MIVYCWQCGTVNQYDSAACVLCGATIVRPPQASVGTSQSSTRATTNPTCPNCHVGIQSTGSMCPRCGYGQSVPDFVWQSPVTTAETVPSPVEPTPPPSAAPTTQPNPTPVLSGPPKPQPRRAGRMTPVALLSLVALVLVVTIVLVAVLRPTTTTNEPGEPDDPGLPAFPGYSAEDCGLVESATVFDYYILGSDRFPTLISSLVLGMVSTCRHDTATSIEATYAISQDYWRQITGDFIWWSQTFAGLNSGPLDEAGGYLWGRSLDAGQWLLIGMFNDPTTGMTITIQKGARDLLPSGLVERVSSLPDTVYQLNEPGTMSFTPVRGWDQYTLTRMPGSQSEVLGLRYNNISKGSFAGTLGILGATTYDMNGKMPLDETAQSWIITFSIRASAEIPPPQETTVEGYPALQYTYTISDTLLRQVFVQGPDSIYVFTAEVDASNPDLLDEIQKIIDSAHFSG